MGVAVVTAVADATWEATLVAGLGDPDLGVTVVRRCVDVADLLAAASAGLARVALVSADLRGLDRDVLTRLAVLGVGVVGVVAPGSSRAPTDAANAASAGRGGEDALRGLGVRRVVPVEAPPALVASALRAVVEDALPASPYDFSGRPPAAAEAASGGLTTPAADHPDDGGRTIAVWGPTGAPGRTSIAIGVAAECAALGRETLLVDADVYGGVVAQSLGLLDESSGVAVACRLANHGSLDADALLQLAPYCGERLRVLTGISRPQRWTELRPAALQAVLAVARTIAEVVVIDCGFCLETDEEIAYDTAAPRRNGATLAAIADADVLLAVATADPIGLSRYVRAVHDLGDAVPGPPPLTVVNRVRPKGAVPGDEEREITNALARYAGINNVRFVPLDVPGFDAALRAGRTLVETAPASRARLALRALAAEIVGADASESRRVGLRRRR